MLAFTSPCAYTLVLTSATKIYALEFHMSVFSRTALVSIALILNFGNINYRRFIILFWATKVNFEVKAISYKSLTLTMNLDKLTVCCLLIY